MRYIEFAWRVQKLNKHSSVSERKFEETIINVYTSIDKSSNRVLITMFEGVTETRLEKNFGLAAWTFFPRSSSFLALAPACFAEACFSL